jgi:hypothetical protein
MAIAPCRRVLYGTVHIRAYDFADGLDTLEAITPRPARLIADRIITAPAEPCVLYPESGVCWGCLKHLRDAGIHCA